MFHFSGSSDDNCRIDACPKSWDESQCKECWLSSLSGSACPPGWCPQNWSSRCHNWARCPRSHCPSYKFIYSGSEDICANWGDCCLLNSDSSGCMYNPSAIKFQ